MKYRKKPVVVEAVQWFPGFAIDGVKEIVPEIILSASGKHFYLSASFPGGCGPGPFRMPDAWLPVEDGEILPFTFWDLKVGETRPASADDPLTKKYLEYAKLTELPQPYGLVDTLEGRMIVSPGDWIITGVKGEIYPCKPDIFEATYEPEADRPRAGEDQPKEDRDV
jgi:hypothetical protein